MASAATGVMGTRGDKSKVKYGYRCPSAEELFDNKEDAVTALQEARDYGFDFILANGIFTKAHYEAIMAGEETDQVTEQVSWCDKELEHSTAWYQGVSAILSDVSEDLTSSNMELRRRAARVWQEEVDTAAHLFLRSVVLDLYEGVDVVQLAQVLESALTNTGLVLWVQLPIAFHHEMPREIDTDEDNGNGEKVEDEGEKETAWMLWDKFRRACNFDSKVRVLLDISGELEPDSQVLLRWLGEPIAGILIAQDCFQSGHGLSPIHEKMVHFFLTATSNFIVDPRGREHTTESPRELKMDMEYYAQTFWDAGPDADVYRMRGAFYAPGGEDYVQNPLQPLQDNLEAPIYELIEKDWVKYSLYGTAIKAALIDLVPEDEKEHKTLVLMVLGAGRGPIVDNAINAIKMTGRKVKIYAIDKNQKAANTLFYRNKVHWGCSVKVVNVDMRDWNPTDKADIIVSELLGSFGDNELSPECLDGAQQLLKEGGVMIPQSYTSFLAPVMSPKMLLANMKYDPVVHYNELTYEVPYVVNLYARYEIAEPKELFSFSHPRQDLAMPNERFGKLSFKPKLDCMLNGFVGYFDCTLYKEVKMSILPSTFTPGMMSWYPLFFPIRTPITIKSSDDIELLFWRRVSKKAVWYEWGLSSPQVLSPHNLDGKAFTIGLN